MNIPIEVIESAEDAYETVAGDWTDPSRSGLEAYGQVVAEWARKEAESERDESLAALGVSRQRFGDSETKRAELEAVIQEMGEATDIRHGSKLDRLDRVAMLSAASPSVVLQDRDREVRAKAIEDAADTAEETMDWGYRVAAPHWLRQHAAAIRADQDGEQS